MTDVLAPARYTVILQGSDDKYTEIDFYSACSFGAVLNSGSTASLTIPCTSAKIVQLTQQSIAPRNSYIRIYRKENGDEPERLLWVGLNLRRSFSGDMNSLSLTMTYESIFNRLGSLRTEADYDEPASTEISDIAWAIISAAQAKVGGNIGITRGADPTTVTRTPGTEFADRSIKEVIETLSSTENGFDFEITPTPRDGSEGIFNVYYTGASATYHKGLIQDTVLTYIKTSDIVNAANNVKQFSLDDEGEKLITFLRMQGATTDSTAILSEVTESTSLGEYGLFEDSTTNNDISNITDLDSYAEEELRTRSVIPQQITLEMLDNDQPRFGTYDVGDIFTVDIQFYNILTLQKQMRLYEWQVNLKNGTESISLSLNTI